MNEEDIRRAKEQFEKVSEARVPAPRSAVQFSSNQTSDTTPPTQEGFTQAGNNGSERLKRGLNLSALEFPSFSAAPESGDAPGANA